MPIGMHAYMCTCRQVSRVVATAVAAHAYEAKIARVYPGCEGRGETTSDFIERKMYYPDYVPIFSRLYD